MTDLERDGGVMLVCPWRPKFDKFSDVLRCESQIPWPVANGVTGEVADGVETPEILDMCGVCGPLGPRCARGVREDCEGRDDFGEAGDFGDSGDS